MATDARFPIKASWTCSTCTFDNVHNENICELCATPRFGAAAPVHPYSAPKPPPSTLFATAAVPSFPHPMDTSTAAVAAAATAAPDPAAISSTSTTWDCLACTFRNETNLNCCELCGEKRVSILADALTDKPASTADAGDEKEHAVVAVPDVVSDDFYPDFVLKDYIRDILDIMDDAGNLEEFLGRMSDLGINSEDGRRRAMIFLSQIVAERQEDDVKEADPLLFVSDDGRSLEEIVSEFRDAEAMIELIQKGYYLAEFLCMRCNVIHEKGIQLSLCSHILCEPCFTESVTATIDAQSIPTCFVCHSNVEISDVNTHIGVEFGNIVNELLFRQSISVSQAAGEWGDTKVFTCLNCSTMVQMQRGGDVTFVCMACGEKNCIRCHKIHIAPETCDSYEFFIDNKFLSFWDDPPAEFDCYSQHLQKCEVGPGEEYNWVLKKLEPARRAVVRIERIQNGQSWNRYSEYCERLTEKGSTINQRWVFHGTRANHPDKIWQSLGFDLRNARIGNCIWFAVNPQYSMSGYGFDAGDGQLQIFMCCVACGESNDNDVKLIRGDMILNVYANEATYPAYLITYR